MDVETAPRRSPRKHIASEALALGLRQEGSVEMVHGPAVISSGREDRKVTTGVSSSSSITDLSSLNDDTERGSPPGAGLGDDGALDNDVSIATPTAVAPTRAGWLRLNEAPPLEEMAGKVKIAEDATSWQRCVGFFGPAVLISVGYVDPGNWATNLAAGAAFGYAHLFIILLSCLIAMFLQTRAVRLGVATGRDLAQSCRDAFSRPVSVGLWITAEIAIMATDVAEVIGTAVALKLLFQLPLWAGTIITICDTLLLVCAHSRVRLIEGFVALLMALILAAFCAVVGYASPPVGDVMRGYVPSAVLMTDSHALYLAIGILGATVMPHNIFLHSAVVHSRDGGRSEGAKRTASRWLSADAVIALSVALVINSLILIVAGAAFHVTGHTDVGDIENAHALLAPVLGASAAPILFAVALWASGQNSTLTGTLAGQTVMEGFLTWKTHPIVRRVVTRLFAISPVLAVVLTMGDGGVSRALVGSQVVLSFQLPFTLIPLMLFTSDVRKMGTDLVNGWTAHLVGWALVLFIIALNIYLLTDIVGSGELFA